MITGANGTHGQRAVLRARSWALLRRFSIGVFLALPLVGFAGVRPPGKTVIEEGFEAELPEFHTYRASYAADDTKAHTGKRCLRVTPATAGTGGAYFKLDGLIDVEHDYEFSAWVQPTTGGARIYISASNGTQRYTIGGASGGKPGSWMRVTGRVRRGDWQSSDCDFMLAMVTTAECWFDDVTLTATLFPPPPIEAYPELERRLRTKADELATQLVPGSTLRLRPADGALAPDISRQEVTVPTVARVPVPADGFLTFAVEAREAMLVTGHVSLAHGDDLRPGLRAYVLCDTTLVAAPLVVAPAWQGVGHAMQGPVPDCEGARPPDRCDLTRWRLDKGRHYLTLAGPHFRDAGVFEHLELRAEQAAADAALYQFALFSDTHVGQGRSTWMNVKMDGPSAAELTSALTALAAQDTAFALIAGDMTDGATRDQFQLLSKALSAGGMPVFGCVGNHDSYHASSRRDVIELCGGLFPGGQTDYVLNRPPLRFLVLDGSYWKSPDGGFMDHYKSGVSRGVGLKPEEVEWLRTALAQDTATPTVVLWHYPVFTPGGVMSSGFKLPPQSSREPLLGMLRAAPNVIATLNGHTHWNAVSAVQGLTHVQNAAFVEWPNMYRVFRVYPDRVEWEVRQAGNRGFIRESFVVERALSWMISTGAGDLAGTVPLTRQ